MSRSLPEEQIKEHSRQVKEYITRKDPGYLYDQSRKSLAVNWAAYCK
jgi:hypothetical protein